MLETSCVLAPFVDTPCSRVVGAGYNTRTMQLQWTGGPGAGFPECMPWDALCAWLKHGGCCCQLSPLGSPRFVPQSDDEVLHAVFASWNLLDALMYSHEPMAIFQTGYLRELQVRRMVQLVRRPGTRHIVPAPPWRRPLDGFSSAPAQRTSARPTPR